MSAVPSVAPVVERTPSPVHIVDSEVLLPGEMSENVPPIDISPSEPSSDTSSVSPTVDSEGNSEYNPAAAYQQQYGFSHPMQPVSSNAGHDKNKQLSAQAAMYQNSGGMTSTVHHQAQMGGPVPSQQPASIVPQGQQINRGSMAGMQINKLEFTLCPTKLKQTPMTYEEMMKNLLSLLRKSEENEEIFDWIDANVQDLENDFIRALVTAVHEDVITVTDQSCKLDASRLKKRSPLLTRYISGSEKLEMQALYAIQYLMNKLGHPTGLLHQIFNNLFDNDVITEDAFKKWEQNDLDETEGKDVAVHSTRSFFTWLRESEPGGEEVFL